ncbi:hypothetical protein TNCT_2241 [Trichonephila clavata]|uniref:Uncharacterized protein n=1 Tax=Trichonephila clavata TaxID=2740835 RepID=A0A8X6H0D7_TRICU|nr:hypothetical protein TNCT_2241 [Trichonephila clavata]
MVYGTGCSTSDCIVERITVGIHDHLQHDSLILLPRCFFGCSRLNALHVGIILCPLLSICSDDTLRTINQVRNTARRLRLACGFRADDLFKLAELCEMSSLTSIWHSSLTKVLLESKCDSYIYEF